MTDERLRELVARAVEAVARMTPEQRAAYEREQKIDFAYGNCVLSNPNVTRVMVEEAYDRLHPKRTP